MPSLIRVSPALGEELPISHTRTIDFSVELNSLDLRSKSFTGILIDAVILSAALTITLILRAKGNAARKEQENQ